MNIRVGTGFDLHRLGPAESLVIGGVSIPHNRGMIGHSDADVLCHAVTDALLGAAAIGNIGELFPDTDPRYRGMSSLVFVSEAAALVRSRGYEIGNVDSTILAERPRLLPHFSAMKTRMAEALGIAPDSIHIKAKTMEGVGAIGSEEAIAAEAVVLIFRKAGPVQS